MSILKSTGRKEEDAGIVLFTLKAIIDLETNGVATADETAAELANYSRSVLMSNLLEPQELSDLLKEAMSMSRNEKGAN
jgi:hypothetical protein